MSALAAAVRDLVLVLVDPAGAHAAAVARRRVALPLAVLVVVLIVLGLATLPRQLQVLAEALGPTGDALLDRRYAVMRPALTRLIIAERLVPLPALLLAGVLAALAAEPFLALPRSDRRALWVVVLLGLVPLTLHRVGEVAITYLLTIPPDPPAGLAVSLPRRFSAGLTLLWGGGGGDPPRWVQFLEPRANAVTLWSVLLWASGFRVLDRRPTLDAWHLLIPLFCLAGGGLVTWALGPATIAAILGRP